MYNNNLLNHIKRICVTYQISRMNKMKKKKNYHAVRTIPNSNIKIVKEGKIDSPNKQILDRYWLFMAWYIIVSCEIVSGCFIFVMKNLTQTERSHRCVLFRPRTLS